MIRCCSFLVSAFTFLGTFCAVAAGAVEVIIAGIAVTVTVFVLGVVVVAGVRSKGIAPNGVGGVGGVPSCCLTCTVCGVVVVGTAAGVVVAGTFSGVVVMVSGVVNAKAPPVAACGKGIGYGGWWGGGSR